MMMTKLDRIAFYIFSATLFLAPFFFLPGANLSLGVAKGIIFTSGIILSFTFFLISRLVEGKLTMPKSMILALGLALAGAFLLSAIFSPSRSASLLGAGFEVGTFGSAALCFMAMFLASFFWSFKDKPSLAKILSFSFIPVVLSALAAFIAGPSSRLARFLPASLAGSWNDMAVFSGLVIIISLLSLEFAPSKKPFKVFTGISAAAAFFLLAAANFYPAWIVVGIFSLFIFIYSFISKRAEGGSNFPAASFTAVILCLIFLIANNMIGGLLPGRLHVQNSEIRPSATATFGIIKDVLRQDPILGSGPNRFSESWMKFKPEAVNQTMFWNSNFNYGSGLIPTFAATTGILGILAWAVFLALFLFNGFFKSATKIELSNYEISAAFLSALFLWIFAAVCVIGPVNFILAFAFTGAFIGALAAQGRIPSIEFSFLKDPRLSFFSILFLVAAIGGSAWGGYAYAQKFAAIAYYEKSSSSPNTDAGLAAAQNYLARAISLDDRDVYYQSLSQLYLLQLNSLIRSQGADKAAVQSALNSALGDAKAAIAKDPENSANWLSMAAVYEQILPYGVEGAYESAKAAIGKAIGLDPKNPGLYLELARADIAAKNTDAANADIGKALELKPDYADAIILLSRLDASSGNFAKAISEIESLAGLYPNDPDLANYLNQLKAGQAQAAAPSTAAKSKKK
jgi:hypothetical protein